MSAFTPIWNESVTGRIMTAFIKFADRENQQLRGKWVLKSCLRNVTSPSYAGALRSLAMPT